MGFFTNILFPKRCFLCDDIISLEENLCKKCIKETKWIEGEICEKCGKPLEKHRLELCLDCSKRNIHYTRGRGLFLYQDKLIYSIHRYKYGTRKGYGKGYGKELIKFFNEKINWEIDLITSVPLHQKKLGERGFNQAALLADILGKGINIEVNNFLLKRTKNTSPQKDLADLARILNVRDAFIINKKYEIRNQNILIIDDIYTTGSTINNCAKILKENGAKEIYFLTLAIGKGS